MKVAICTSASFANKSPVSWVELSWLCIEIPAILKQLMMVVSGSVSGSVLEHNHDTQYSNVWQFFVGIDSADVLVDYFGTVFSF